MLSINSENFESEVIQSKVPVVVDFWAPWCAPCKKLKPLLEAMDVESNGAYKIVGINTDEAAELAVKFDISSIPTLIIFKNGGEMNRLFGLQTKENLLKGINDVLGEN